MQSRCSQRWFAIITLLVLCPALALALVPPAVSSQATQGSTLTTADREARPVSVMQSVASGGETIPGDAKQGNFSLAQHLLLDYSSRSQASRTSQLLQGLCSQPDPDRGSVRQCTVFGHGSLVNQTAVAEGLSCLPNLKDLYWQALAPLPSMRNFLETRLHNTWIHLDLTARYEVGAQNRLRLNDFASLAGHKSQKSESTYRVRR